MPKVEPFERHTEAYESWFEKHRGFYASELNLLKTLIKKTPPSAVEVGVGSGRFAAPLGVPYGVDPSPSMLKIARRRGVKVIRGAAENLPLKRESFQLVLMVTTICFVDDPLKALSEAYAVLKKGGRLVVGFVDADSPLGKLYRAKKNKSKFYREARFFTAEEIIDLAKRVGFRLDKALQTLFGTEDDLYPTREGFGEGSFVGLSFYKGRVDLPRGGFVK